MKTKILYCTLVAAALSVGAALGDEQKPAEKSLPAKTGDTLKKAGETVVDDTKKVGNTIVDGTKKAATAVKDAVTPESDARKVDVTLTEKRIDMMREIPSGKTAFVVRNDGKERQNFKIEGAGLDKEFMIGVAPNDTKTLNVDLKPGEYKVFVPAPGKSEAPKGSEQLTLKVK